MSLDTPTLSPVAGLRRAVLLDPASDDARLVLADALDEHGGEMEAKWAELIRCGCELARLPKRRQLFVADGAGKMMEGLGVALAPRGAGHYSASSLERGLSTETFLPGERVDIYAHLARRDRIGWMRGMKYVKHIEDRHEIIFRKDEQSKPCHGTELAARESTLLRDLTPWLRRGERCERCKGKGSWQTGPHGEECRACHGIGWLGSLADVPEDRITFSRGFVGRVELTVEQVQDAAFLARLFGEWPVTGVAYTGRIPSWATVLSSREIVSLGREAAGLPQIGEAS